MVPQSIMLIDSVPLSPTGKLDRNALPEPVFGAARGYRAPSTPVEIALCAAFAEVLEVAVVGADDGFFELGGNSLLATKVVARMRAVGYELPVQLMFGESSPAGIARGMAGGDGFAQAVRPLLALRAARPDSREPLFCVHPAIGLSWSWCYSGLLPHLPADRPVYGLQAPHVAGAESHTSIAEAAAAYITQLREVQPDGPYHLLGWSLGGLIAHEMAVQLRQAGERVALLALLDSYELSDRWVDQAVPGIADILGEFGPELPAGALPENPTLEQAAEVLAGLPGPFAALTLDQLRALHTGYTAGAAMAHGFRPGVFDGDLVFFAAADDEINRADPERRAAAWQPHVTGTVHDHSLPLRHAAMTTPEALAVIGPVLREHLGDNASGATIPDRTTSRTEQERS
jgi:thioesterase domain-containing protein